MKNSISKTKKELEHFVFLKDNKTTVLFNKENLSVSQLNENTDQLEKLFLLLKQNKENLASEVSEKVSYIIDHFHEDELSLPKDLAHSDEFGKEDKENKEKLKELKPTKPLYKLAINTANSCNLRCKYCYANHGLYAETKASLMKPEILKQTLTHFASYFDYIQSIQFMGGEPSLATEILKLTHTVCEDLVNKGQLKDMPRLGMVSNGVGYTDSLWQIIKDIKLGITFSLDGPKEVHDRLRVDAHNKGSFDEVISNIKRAKDLGMQPGFEATFTREHLNQGVHLTDLCQWFYDQFGCRFLHAPPMGENAYVTEGDLGLSLDEKIYEYGQACEWGIENLKQKKLVMLSFTERILRSLINKEKSYSLCPAGESLLAVSTQGDIYPCWQFTGAEVLKMGSVDDDHFFGVRMAAVIEALKECDLNKNPLCQDCWIKPLCFGCKGSDFLATGKINQHPDCAYFKEMFKKTILSSVRVLQKEV